MVPCVSDGASKTSYNIPDVDTLQLHLIDFLFLIVFFYSDA